MGYHTYLISYMTDLNNMQNGYGNEVFATESTGELLYLDAKHFVISKHNFDDAVILSLCKLD